MTDIGTGRVTVHPDFTALIRAFGELGAAVRALGETFDKAFRVAGRPPRRTDRPQRARPLSMSYHRRHVRNRRRSAR